MSYQAEFKFNLSIIFSFKSFNVFNLRHIIMQWHWILGPVNGNPPISPRLSRGLPQYRFISIFFRCCEPIRESSIICQRYILSLSFNINYKTFSIYSKYKITTSHPTIAYTHPTSHTNTLNHYHFVLKQIKKLKTKFIPITNFNFALTNINKNIKPNNKKNSHDKSLTIQIYIYNIFYFL